VRVQNIDLVTLQVGRQLADSSLVIGLFDDLYREAKAV